ncbi:tail fiber protein [Citrobacter sp. Marseille-Q3906]|uniref:gp53-like domain-containing protein n=1 Tax=Citrobacter sp. Marseille-Q3906 TaxID=2866574 RepID=UPI001CE45ACE|nr:tail fiber protein [Citrobacter sp. Marseille-Q3906]
MDSPASLIPPTRAVFFRGKSMSKIARYQGNVRAFASDAQGMERTVFGGTNQADDLTSQITASFLRGWGIVGASEHPSLEDFNAAMYAMSQFIAYQHQMGVPEWHAEQEYHIGSICTHNGESYQSLQNANIGSQPPSAKWTPVLTSKNGLANLGLRETLNPSKRVSIGALGTGVFDGSKPAINIGDSDSGFVFESDGVIGVYANSQKIAELTNTEFKIIGNASLVNGALLLGGLTHFIRHTAADDAGFGGNNVEIGSWNGIGLTCTYDGTTRIYFNTRTGEIGLRGDLKADGNVRSGNAWLDQTGNLQGSAWGAGVGLKAYLDNTFNRKNTASLDTNGWHRDESTGLITQWGLIDQANGTYNFPRAFPNQCFVVLVTNTNAQGSGVDNAFGYPISNSQFVASSKNNGGGIGPYPVAFKALGR